MTIHLKKKKKNKKRRKQGHFGHYNNIHHRLFPSSKPLQSPFTYRERDSVTARRGFRERERERKAERKKKKTQTHKKKKESKAWQKNLVRESISRFS